MKGHTLGPSEGCDRSERAEWTSVSSWVELIRSHGPVISAPADLNRPGLTNENKYDIIILLYFEQTFLLYMRY